MKRTVITTCSVVDIQVVHRLVYVLVVVVEFKDQQEIKTLH